MSAVRERRSFCELLSEIARDRHGAGSYQEQGGRDSRADRWLQWGGVKSKGRR